jgi:hypothetical protein
MKQSCTVTLLLNWQKRSKAVLPYSTFTGDLTLQISATLAFVWFSFSHGDAKHPAKV